jgi:hypothetical protein
MFNICAETIFRFCSKILFYFYGEALLIYSDNSIFAGDSIYWACESLGCISVEGLITS